MSQFWPVWEVGRRDSASPKVELGEFYEDGLRLGELDEQLGESYEDCLELDELFLKLGKSYELLLSKRCNTPKFEKPRKERKPQV